MPGSTTLVGPAVDRGSRIPFSSFSFAPTRARCYTVLGVTVAILGMDDRSDQVMAVAILFFVLCWITVSLRTYCRWQVIHSVGIDDQLLLVLLVSAFLPLSPFVLGEAYRRIGYLHSLSRVSIGSVEAWHRETRRGHIS